MNYLIVEDNIITNIIVCENDDIAEEFNAFPYYGEVKIGDMYNPPIPEKKLKPDEDTLEYMGNALNDGINEI